MDTVVKTVNFVHENYINVRESLAILRETKGGIEK
jgi:hypothetical protein